MNIRPGLYLLLLLGALVGSSSAVHAAQEAMPAKQMPPAQKPDPIVDDPGAIIKTYLIQHTTPAELKTILISLVPNLQVVLGPQPKYIRDVPAGEALGTETETLSSSKAPAGGKDVSVSDQFVRMLLLKGLPATIEKAMAILKEVDIQSPQVLIEVEVMELTEGLTNKLGIGWDFAPNGTTADFTLGTPKQKGTWDSVAFGRLDRSPINFTATLQAALQNNKAKLLASPRLTVLYNHRAKIFIGDEVTYLVGTNASQNGTTFTTNKIKVGVELNVTAAANPDGTINLKVNPEVGTLTSLGTLPNGVSLPDVGRRAVVSSVRLKDGETMVIAGLIGQNEAKTVNKIPFLGDLPLLGHLFRQDSKSKSKDELVIFLKATVMKE